MPVHHWGEELGAGTQGRVAVYWLVPRLQDWTCSPCFYCGQAMPLWAQFPHHKLNACCFMVSARSRPSALLAQGSQRSGFKGRSVSSTQWFPVFSEGCWTSGLSSLWGPNLDDFGKLLHKSRCPRVGGHSLTLGLQAEISSVVTRQTESLKPGAWPARSASPQFSPRSLSKVL